MRGWLSRQRHNKCVPAVLCTFAQSSLQIVQTEANGVILFEQRSLRIVAADFFWDSRCLLPLETWFVIRFVLVDFDAVSNYK